MFIGVPPPPPPITPHCGPAPPPVLWFPASGVISAWMPIITHNIDTPTPWFGRWVVLPWEPYPATLPHKMTTVIPATTSCQKLFLCLRCEAAPNSTSIIPAPRKTAIKHSHQAPSLCLFEVVSCALALTCNAPPERFRRACIGLRQSNVELHVMESSAVV